ncbi:MAG TPA: DUF4129 domain-containing protein [Candidatus Binatia bacterium]|nr:DUF4129 domain-containing protein [Candidatus Binatia bacterium]
MAALQVNPVPPAEKIREATRQILDRPEFAEPSRWYQTLIDLLNAIKQWLDRLGNWSEAHPALARALFIVALVILVACLAHLLYLALADVLPFKRRQDTAAPRPARWEILQGTAANWREALRLARAMINEGNSRRAVWIAHRVLLGLLDQQGAVKFAGWKTNTHYLGECAHDHPWRATFAELTELYEQAVYASRQISAAAAEQLVARVDRLCGETGMIE